jgi:hypothetical protein
MRTALASALSPGGLLFNASSGLFSACSQGPNALPDVWGSALAVHLGLLDAKQVQVVGAALVDPGAGVFSAGQVRHLPQPLVWGACFGGGCPAAGTYQVGPPPAHTWHLLRLMCLGGGARETVL